MKKAFTLIELIMVIVIVGILITLAIPNVTRSYIISNESAAQSNARLISAALENYAVANSGDYATSEGQLTGATPPYLTQSLCGKTLNGYTYACTSWSTSSYTITASPSSCGGTGSKTYTVTTGGAFSSANCI